MDRFNSAPVSCPAGMTGSGSFPRSAVAAVVGAAVLAIVSVAPAAGQPSAKPFFDPCRNFNWRAGLEADQNLVLSKAPLHVRHMEEALAPGGALENYEPDHLFAELLGNGTTLSLKDQSQIGRPDFFLFYAGRPSTVEDASNAALPKNPYTLVGWAYLVPFDYAHPNSRPIESAPGFGRCIPQQDWLIHEAGFHLLDGSFVPTPGAQVPPIPPPFPPPILLWHPRVWDLHVWINLCGSPVVGFLNQLPDGRLVSGTGYAAPTGSFFYPPIAPRGSFNSRWDDFQGRVCSPID